MVRHASCWDTESTAVSVRRLSPAVILVVGIVTAIALYGCDQHDAAPPVVPTVNVMHPQIEETKLTVELPGDVVGFYEAALHAKVTGYVQSISVDKGDHVKRGQVLAMIEVPELHANLEHAKADLAIQKITYERLKKVQTSDPRLVSQEDVDMAYAKYKQAQASVDMLETMFGYTQIVAPFDGIITGRCVDPGALVRAGGGDIGVNETSGLISPGATEGAGGHRTGGGPILTIARLDKLRVYIYVPGRWCRYIRRDTPAKLTFDELPGLVLNGSVARYAAALDLTTRTMLTEIDIQNPGGVIYPRMYARVTLDLGPHRDALRLPLSAVSGGGADASVFSVADGRLVKVPVSTGVTNGTYVQIMSGLKPSMLVVVPFSTALRDGQKVRYTILTSREHPADEARYYYRR